MDKYTDYCISIARVNKLSFMRGQKTQESQTDLIKSLEANNLAIMESLTKTLDYFKTDFLKSTKVVNTYQDVLFHSADVKSLYNRMLYLKKLLQRGLLNAHYMGGEEDKYEELRNLILGEDPDLGISSTDIEEDTEQVEPPEPEEDFEDVELSLEEKLKDALNFYDDRDLRNTCLKNIKALEKKYKGDDELIERFIKFVQKKLFLDLNDTDQFNSFMAPKLEDLEKVIQKYIGDNNIVASWPAIDLDELLDFIKLKTRKPLLKKSYLNHYVLMALKEGLLYRTLSAPTPSVTPATTPASTAPVASDSTPASTPSIIPATPVATPAAPPSTPDEYRQYVKENLLDRIPEIASRVLTILGDGTPLKSTLSRGAFPPAKEDGSSTSSAFNGAINIAKKTRPDIVKFFEDYKSLFTILCLIRDKSNIASLGTLSDDNLEKWYEYLVSTNFFIRLEEEAAKVSAPAAVAPPAAAVTPPTTSVPVESLLEKRKRLIEEYLVNKDLTAELAEIRTRISQDLGGKEFENFFSHFNVDKNHITTTMAALNKGQITSLLLSLIGMVGEKFISGCFVKSGKKITDVVDQTVLLNKLTHAIRTTNLGSLKSTIKKSADYALTYSQLKAVPLLNSLISPIIDSAPAPSPVAPTLPIPPASPAPPKIDWKAQTNIVLSEISKDNTLLSEIKKAINNDTFWGQWVPTANGQLEKGITRQDSGNGFYSKSPYKFPYTGFGSEVEIAVWGYKLYPGSNVSSTDIEKYYDVEGSSSTGIPHIEEIPFALSMGTIGTIKSDIRKGKLKYIPSSAPPATPAAPEASGKTTFSTVDDIKKYLSDTGAIRKLKSSFKIPDSTHVSEEELATLIKASSTTEVKIDQSKIEEAFKGLEAYKSSTPQDIFGEAFSTVEKIYTAVGNNVSPKGYIINADGGIINPLKPTEVLKPEYGNFSGTKIEKTSLNSDPKTNTFIYPLGNDRYIAVPKREEAYQKEGIISEIESIKDLIRLEVEKDGNQFYFKNMIDPKYSDRLSIEDKLKRSIALKISSFNFNDKKYTKEYLQDFLESSLAAADTSTISDSDKWAQDMISNFDTDFKQKMSDKELKNHFVNLFNNGIYGRVIPKSIFIKNIPLLISLSIKADLLNDDKLKNRILDEFALSKFFSKEDSSRMGEYNLEVSTFESLVSGDLKKEDSSLAAAFFRGYKGIKWSEISAQKIAIQYVEKLKKIIYLIAKKKSERDININFTRLEKLFNAEVLDKAVYNAALLGALENPYKYINSTSEEVGNILKKVYNNYDKAKEGSPISISARKETTPVTQGENYLYPLSGNLYIKIVKGSKKPSNFFDLDSNLVKKEGDSYSEIREKTPASTPSAGDIVPDVSTPAPVDTTPATVPTPPAPVSDDTKAKDTAKSIPTPDEKKFIGAQEFERRLAPLRTKITEYYTNTPKYTLSGSKITDKATKKAYLYIQKVKINEDGSYSILRDPKVRGDGNLFWEDNTNVTRLLVKNRGESPLGVVVYPITRGGSQVYEPINPAHSASISKRARILKILNFHERALRHG